MLEEDKITKNRYCRPIYELYNCPYADKCRRRFSRLINYHIETDLDDAKLNTLKIWEILKEGLTPKSRVWFNKLHGNSSINICQSSKNIETFFEREIKK